MPMAVHYHYNKFPPAQIDWHRLIHGLGPANAALARYDGSLSAIPNPAVLLSPLTTREAVLSSRIEGTQATMGEVLEYEAENGSRGFSQEKEADIHEILNYRKAIRHAVELLEELPLCQRVIKEAHRILLSTGRGQGKSPGEYRRIPNWIGPPGCTMEEARFVPISADQISQAMNDWENYIHSAAPDRLVQLAILHAEFEALHPFLDGNGRLGRMLVPLFLHNVGLIHTPMFYISAFFEQHRDEYYEKLLAISRDDDWTGWCEFFLKAIMAQAIENQQKTADILGLYERKKTEICDLTHSQYAIHALDFLFAQPFFKSTDFTNKEEIPTPTAKRMVTVLRNQGILRTIREASGRRPAIYAFEELIEITER